MLRRSVGYGAYGGFSSYTPTNGIGFFGKGASTPAPAPPTPDLILSEEVVIEDEPAPVPDRVVTQVVPEAAPREDAELRYLREAVAKAKAAREAKAAQLREHQEKQRKQAAYGRDVIQAKPKAAGYTTEAEKLMGGSTGYYVAPKPAAGFGFFGQASLNKATNAVVLATKAVKQVENDVKAGVATKSDLSAAIADLNSKIASMKAVSPGLGGFSGTSLSVKKVAAIAAVGIVIYLVTRG